MLVQAGVFTTEPSRRFSQVPTPTYDSSFVHLAILNDTARKNAFVRAVRELVTPGDVVLDLGTGSGILAIVAAQAGARRVYAVEPASMVHLAERVARDNGVADKITFLRAWSTQLRLPEKANLLTTDIVGNEALDMVIWENVQDARGRLLTGDARLMPSALNGLAVLVDIPDHTVAEHRVDQAQLRRWTETYGIDFGALMESQRLDTTGFYARPEVVQQWTPLSASCPLYDLDLNTEVRSIDETRVLTASRGGAATGVVVYFRARLSPSVTFSSDPWRGGENSHWFTAVWAFPSALSVRAGDTVTVRFRYQGEGQSRLELVAASDSKGGDSDEAA
jgi:SAM-dependent methyltransferase